MVRKNQQLTLKKDKQISGYNITKRESLELINFQSYISNILLQQNILLTNITLKKQNNINYFFLTLYYLKPFFFALKNKFKKNKSLKKTFKFFKKKSLKKRFKKKKIKSIKKKLIKKNIKKLKISCIKKIIKINKIKLKKQYKMKKKVNQKVNQKVKNIKKKDLNRVKSVSKVIKADFLNIDDTSDLKNFENAKKYRLLFWKAKKNWKDKFSKKNHYFNLGKWLKKLKIIKSKRILNSKLQNINSLAFSGEFKNIILKKKLFKKTTQNIFKKVHNPIKMSKLYFQNSFNQDIVFQNMLQTKNNITTIRILNAKPFINQDDFIKEFNDKIFLFKKFLFPKSRYSFFDDFVKLTSFFLSNFIKIAIYIQVLKILFESLHKKVYWRFYKFLTKLAQFFLKFKYSQISGIKICIHGKIKRSMRSQLYRICLGRISTGVLKYKSDFSQTYFNSVLGCFGCAIWIGYKNNKDSFENKSLSITHKQINFFKKNVYTC